MDPIKIEDLNPEISISDDEIKCVKGGIALLLPAVQKIRESATAAGHEKWIELESVRWS